MLSIRFTLTQKLLPLLEASVAEKEPPFADPARVINIGRFPLLCGHSRCAVSNYKPCRLCRRYTGKSARDLCIQVRVSCFETRTPLTARRLYMAALQRRVLRTSDAF